MSENEAGKRDIFSELMEAVVAMKERREGNLVLQTHLFRAG